ncbi:MAG: DUF6452 family protein [Bacteroides sp.]|nr:DUF6452 family protein [Bacteroides sp.]MCM1379263.1 DUF6452 family protein [Bacteroides sp.]MCM1445079.1 DUF6452 family protein [Prevotella sp.]
MKQLWWIVMFVLGLTALASCSGEGCTNNRNSIPLAGFYELDTEQQVSVSRMPIYGVGAPNDSSLVDTARSSQQVYLPLRGNQTQAAFVFDGGPLKDTLTINYESYPYYDGEDCGAMWRYLIHNVSHTNNFIDSILVTDPLITNIERERLMIFLKLPTAEE